MVVTAYGHDDVIDKIAIGLFDKMVRECGIESKDISPFAFEVKY